MCHGSTIVEEADHKDFPNFRPVSNVKYVSKLIEKAVAVQLNDYISGLQ